MKKFILVLCLLCLCFSCNNTLDHTINYTVTPSKDHSSLNVKMTFQANENGQTTLLFQDKAWGQDSLHNVIHDVKVFSEQAEITTNRDSGWYVISHPKNLDQIEVEYAIKQDSKGDLKTRQSYRPIIQPQYFHLFSHNFFMLPKHVLKQSEDNFNVNISWNGFPEDYKLVNSFGSGEYYQAIEGISEEKFHTAVFVGGDFRAHEMDINGNKVVFAIRGDWEVFEDSEMLSILEKTVTAQREFWQDNSQKYYVVTMIPTVQERGSSFQGSGLTNSFATNASNNEYLEVSGLVYLFNHELQHNWIGSLIRNDDEEKQYWFSEGFTDYYTLKNIAKNNIYNYDEGYFINEFNAFVKALYTNPAREMPNSEMTYDNFWSGKEGIQKLSYRRGAFLAFYLDQKIKQDSEGVKSLDDVMLDFKNDAEKTGQKITHTYFIKAVNKYLKEDFQSFFNLHIEEGKLYDFKSIYDEFGFEYQPTSKVFDLGFTFSEDRKQIASIDEKSEAYKAGLRQGDSVKGMSYYYDSIDHEAEFTIEREGEEVLVKYLPIKEVDLPKLLDNDFNKSHLDF